MKSKWNFIEYFNLFMMFCIFIFGVILFVFEKLIMINLDFIYKVFVCNIYVINLKDILNEVSYIEYFVKFLDYWYVDEYSSVCFGIVCNEKLE